MAKFDKTSSIDIEDIQIDEKDLLKKKEKLEDIQNNNNLEKADIDSEGIDKIVNNDFQEQTIVTSKITGPKIGIAADHRGYRMKQKLTNYLVKKGYDVVDYGGEGLKDDDYTEFGFKLGEAIKKGEVEKGIAICGSGIGISIACNKVPTVRCGKVSNTRDAKWTRRDNDANAIALSAKMPIYRAKDIVDVFLKSKFKDHERHIQRIERLNNYK